MLTPYLARCPLVAILRGITPTASVSVAELLIECGFSIIEVPLNSPDALESIQRISDSLGQHALIGAGTVTDARQVDDVACAGGRLVVSPNCDSRVILQTIHRGMASVPGCCTPTEAFAAVQAGADAIKLFPASMVSPQSVAALRVVLPPIPLLAVGGIDEKDFQAYLQAGADGFGAGSGLYRPGKSIPEIREKAMTLVAAIQRQSTATKNNKYTKGKRKVPCNSPL